MKGHGGHTRKHAGSAKHGGTGKHRPRTAAQQAATHKWQQAGAKARHAHVVGSHQQHAKPSTWSPNLDIACCAAEALAASLRLTGRPVSPDDVLDLYWHTTADPDGGATIWDTIHAAAEYGLGGVQLLDARSATEVSTGVVLGVDLAERHAVTLDGHGVWTWGEWRPVSCSLLAAADEAWELTWPQ